MKIVLQRVSKASVSVEGKTIGAIDDGFLILLGRLRYGYGGDRRQDG